MTCDFVRQCPAIRSLAVLSTAAKLNGRGRLINPVDELEAAEHARIGDAQRNQTTIRRKAPGIERDGLLN